MEAQFAQRIETIRHPADPSMLQASAPIRIALFRSEADLDAPRIIELDDVPLYYTVEDFARAFWVKMGKGDDYAPDNVFFGVPKGGDSARDTWYVNLKTLTYAGKQKEVIGLYHPYRSTTANQPTIYKEYVGKEGERILLKTYDRRKMSLEDIFYGDERLPVIHAYPLAGIIQKYGEKTIGLQKVWNGAVYPFYGINEPRTLKPSERILMAKLVEEKHTQLNAIQRAFQATPSVNKDEYALSARGIKQISYLWSKKPEEFPGVDMIFYNSDVNEIRPFMRFYPRAGTVINKVFQPDPMEPPYVNDPLLYRSWAAEKSPSPDEDFLMIKSEIRHESPPLYGSFRINGDGSADFIMLPPKNVRVLDPVYDLSRFYKSIAGTIEGTTYKIEDAQFYRGTFIYELKLPQELKGAFNEQKIADRIQRMSRYFQINKPHKDKVKTDNTFLMLRYKAVSNYAKENDVELFITQWMEKSGDIASEEGIQALKEEFGMETDAALEAVRNYTEKSGQFGIADEDDKHFVSAFNPGIDINIYYDKYVTLTFHIYRVDSIPHLQRLTALLQVLFLSSDSVWGERGTEPIPEEAEAAESAESWDEDESNAGSTDSASSGIIDLSRPRKTQAQTELKAPSKKAAALVENDNDAEAAPEEIDPIVSADCADIQDKKLTADKVEKFFIKNLHDVDQLLTNWKSIKEYQGPEYKKMDPYSLKCQAYDNRQPFALTEAQFTQIKNIYEEDLKTDMAFIVYGTPGYQKDYTNALKMMGNKKLPYEPDIITVLRYGSDPKKLNYYICAEYVCVKDKIFLRKRDFKSNKKRDGVTPKPGIDIKSIDESEWEMGAYKGKGSCPFCCGKLIEDKANPQPGQTVLQRFKKKQGRFPQTDIGIINPASHPKGLGMPCCFAPSGTKKVKLDDALAWNGSVFKHIREAEAAAEAPVEVSTSIKKTVTPTIPQKGQRVKDLSLLRTEIHREYIADESKYPANYGSVAKATAAIDTYFGQKSELIVTREKQKQIINPQAYGFFRVGVNTDIQSSKRSFFAALAPIIGRNSVEEVVQDFAIGEDNISQVIKPHIYTNLNFGNLLLEFFNPGDYEKFMNDNDLRISLEEFKEVLQNFSTTYLSSAPIGPYQYELTRLFLSYRRFMDYIRGKTSDRIQYRHFFHMLAERGLFVRNTVDETTKKSVNGLTIIVLEYNGDPTDPTTQVTVRCPPYGFDLERYEKNDVCFMTVDDRGFWEPLLYVEPVVPGHSMRQAYYRIPYEKFAKAAEKPGALPQNIRERFFEFRNKCSAGAVYRGIYSAQVGIDSSLLSPVSSITDDIIKARRNVEGVLRDAYNHLVGIVVSFDTRKPNSHIIIPASDDGNMQYFDTIKYIFFGFDPRLDEKNILQYKNYADAYDVYQFYHGKASDDNFKMERIIAKNPGYAFKSFICVAKKRSVPPTAAAHPCQGGTVVGYRLQNGILLPCRRTRYEELAAKLKDESSNVKFESIPYNADFTFVQDRKIIREALTFEERKSQDMSKHIDASVLNREELEEIYTHFRLTFSNWLRSDDAGPQLRTRIRKLIMDRSDISTEEKRLTLHYVFAPLMQSWILQRDEDNVQDRYTSLIRKDCRMILFKDQCDGHCAWKEDAGKGRCMLHVPSQIDLETGGEAETITDVAEYFIQRLIYEIIHIPLSYHEITEGSIPHIIPLKTNVHIEGETGVKDQWVIPENVPAWHDLLYNPRAGLAPAEEKPVFYEEFSDADGLQAQEQTDAILENIFGPAAASQLIMKKIGTPKSADSKYGPARDVLIYHDVLDKANNQLWTEEVLRGNAPLTTELLENLSTLIGNYPIVFVDASTNSMNYGLKMTTQSKKQQVYIIIYHKNEEGLYEASVVIPYGLLVEYVPLDRLQETDIYNQIRDAPLVPRVIAPPPAPAAAVAKKRRGPVPPPAAAKTRPAIIETTDE